MKKIVSRGACLLLASCLSLNAVGCQKSNENNKIKEGQSISSEEAGMSINANGKNETFNPTSTKSCHRSPVHVRYRSYSDPTPALLPVL